MGSQSHLAVLLLIVFALSTHLSVPSLNAAHTEGATHSSTLAGTCRAQDSLALVDFYASTRGPQDWIIKWDLSQPISTWHGIGLNDAGCVSCIDLDGQVGCTISVSFGNGLTGYLPESLGNLKSLEKLLLGNNRISGVVPAKLFELQLLEVVDIFANEMIGPLPASIGHAGEMTTLSLAGNNIDGSIPPSIGKAGKLQDFFLDNNKLTGIIPPEIGNAKQLRRIRLHNNNLTGVLPIELGQLSELISLNVAENNISGIIPIEIGRLSKLVDLIMANNEISGNIPHEIGGLNSLRTLRLCHNKLIGPLPLQVGDLAKVEQFWANDNSLNGEIPKEIGNCEFMTDFRLNNNEFTGNIPTEIGNLTYLRKVNFSHNKLIGPLPSNLDSLRRLQELIISDNKLSQKLPDQISSLSSIRIIRAENNQFIGPLPSRISNLERLSELQLSNNVIDGSIPPDYGESASLMNLDLSNNNLSGCFPESLKDKCTRAYTFENNPELPWLGDYNQFCQGKSQIHAICSTGTGTSGETIQEDCSCSVFVCSPTHIDQDAYLCGDEQLTIGTTSHHESGQVIDTLLTKMGCDSIITTNIHKLSVGISTSNATCHDDTNGSAEIETSIAGLFDYSVYNENGDVIATGEQVDEVPDLTNVLSAGQYKLELSESNIACKLSSNFTIGAQYSEIEETYETGIKCPNDELIINGNTYDNEKRTGTELLKSSAGCDSTVVIDLDFIEYNIDVTNVNCENENTGRIQCLSSIPDEEYSFTLRNKANEIIISGNNTSSKIDSDNTLAPGDYQLEINSIDLGCTYEKTINVSSNYETPEPVYIDQILCPGESYFINNNEYNEASLEGLEKLSTRNGCDSIVNIQLAYLESPEARDDIFIADNHTDNISVIDNDQVQKNSKVSISILDFQNADTVTVNANNEIEFVIDEQFSGLTIIEYELCLDECDLCTTARARVTTEGDGFDEDIITPNNDGYNEVLVVSGYSEYETIPQCRINVINRWGQVVYTAENYSNDWAGFKHGDLSKPLPEGVYYYHLLYTTGKSIMGSRSLIR